MDETSRKFDSGKEQYHLIPPKIIKILAEIFTFGATKYEPNNWMNLPDFENRYYDALKRHLEAWRAGEHYDADSGMLHVGQAFWNAGVLLWKEIQREENGEIVREISFEQALEKAREMYKARNKSDERDKPEVHNPVHKYQNEEEIRCVPCSSN